MQPILSSVLGKRTFSQLQRDSEPSSSSQDEFVLYNHKKGDPLNLRNQVRIKTSKNSFVKIVRPKDGARLLIQGTPVHVLESRYGAGLFRFSPWLGVNAEQNPSEVWETDEE